MCAASSLGFANKSVIATNGHVESEHVRGVIIKARHAAALSKLKTKSTHSAYDSSRLRTNNCERIIQSVRERERKRKS